jgi:hypothetical protein
MIYSLVIGKPSQSLRGASHFCKNTPALANGIRGYTDKTHLRGFQIL